MVYAEMGRQHAACLVFASLEHLIFPLKVNGAVNDLIPAGSSASCTSKRAVILRAVLSRVLLSMDLTPILCCVGYDVDLLGS